MIRHIDTLWQVQEPYCRKETAKETEETERVSPYTQLTMILFLAQPALSKAEAQLLVQATRCSNVETLS